MNFYKLSHADVGKKSLPHGPILSLIAVKKALKTRFRNILVVLSGLVNTLLLVTGIGQNCGPNNGTGEQEYSLGKMMLLLSYRSSILVNQIIHPDKNTPEVANAKWYIVCYAV